MNGSLSDDDIDVSSVIRDDGVNVVVDGIVDEDDGADDVGGGVGIEEVHSLRLNPPLIDSIVSLGRVDS